MIQSLAAASLVDVLVVAAVRHKEKKKINQSYFIPVKGYSLIFVPSTVNPWFSQLALKNKHKIYP